MLSSWGAARCPIMWGCLCLRATLWLHLCHSQGKKQWITATLMGDTRCKYVKAQWHGSNSLPPLFMPWTPQIYNVYSNLQNFYFWFLSRIRDCIFRKHSTKEAHPCWFTREYAVAIIATLRRVAHKTKGGTQNDGEHAKRWDGTQNDGEHTKRRVARKTMVWHAKRWYGTQNEGWHAKRWGAHKTMGVGN